MMFKQFNYSKMGLAFLSISVISCASGHKAEKISTEIQKKQEITGDTALGINNDGNMVVQKKVLMSEELRSLQNEVFGLEDRVYGNRKYGSLGLYGVLRDCRLQLVDPKNGGDGKLKWSEPIERVTEKEDDYKLGIDEKDKLVGVNEEYLKDRLTRFKEYKSTLSKRQDEYEDKVAICKSELKNQKSKFEKGE